MKAIRYIFFIPIIYLIIEMVFMLIPLSAFGLLKLSIIWLILLMFFFGGFLVSIFQLLPGGITWIIAKISPSRKFAFYSILTISLLVGYVRISGLWTMPGIFNNGLDTLLALLLTCLTVGITTSLCVGAGIDLYDLEESFIGIIATIGSIIFYIGIILTFCFLTNVICNINPEKSYSWYSGIWHGLFVIPNWIVSWFSSEIYCKAPSSTFAYSVWWWITLIFTIMGIFGGSNNRKRYR